jgi:uncharacterized protein YicC (UPF0701 family)
MTAFVDDLAALADQLEAAATEAGKRREVRESEGRALSPALRSQLERCQAAVGQLLAEPAPARSGAEVQAELRAALDRLESGQTGPISPSWPRVREDEYPG